MSVEVEVEVPRRTAGEHEYFCLYSIYALVALNRALIESSLSLHRALIALNRTPREEEYFCSGSRMLVSFSSSSPRASTTS